MALIREVLLDARRALQDAGCDSPDLESDVLLAHVLGVSRSRLLAMRGDVLGDLGRVRFEELLSRRVAREPLAYIVGATEFYGRTFTVAPGILIPRVDTETLVDAVLEELDGIEGKDRLVLELGVGSGCVIGSVLAEAPNATGIGVDISEAALGISRKNATALGVIDRLELHASNWFKSVQAKYRNCFDVVVSNPPYIDSAELEGLQPEVRDHEPRIALFASNSGFAAIETLLSQAHEWLRPGGLLLIEIGFGQANEATAIAGRFPYSNVHMIADTAGIARVLSARAASLA